MEKMNRKRILAALVSLFLVFGFTSCSSGSPSVDQDAVDAEIDGTEPEETTKAESEAEDTTEVDMDVVEIEFMNMDQAWKVVNFGNDPVTKKFMEETGVKFICSAPQGEWEQIANVMLVSQDYPEVMHMNINSIFNQYVTAGALMPINEMSEEYGYDSIMNGDYIPEAVIRSRSSEDGNLYCVPNWFSEDGFGSVGTAMNVRNDIMKQFDDPEIKTMDDLYDLLIKIRDANLTSPDGAKLWPMAYKHDDKQYFGYMANLWGSQIYMFNYFDEETQDVKFMLRNPTVLEALKFLSKCYQEGLMDPEVLTYDGNTRLEAYNQGKHAIIFCEVWDLWTPNSALSQMDPEMYFYAMEPPAGSDSAEKFFGRVHKSGGSGFMVTKNCKNPEAAMRFIDYFLSPEGETLNFYGIEGDTMEFRDGKPYLFEEAYEAKLADWDGFAFSKGVRIFDFMNNQNYNWERDQESPERQKDRAVATEFAFDGTTQSVIIVDPLTEEGVLLAEIEVNLMSELTKLIMEPDPAAIETKLAELLAEYERKGVVDLEAEWTKQYLSKMG